MKKILMQCTTKVSKSGIRRETIDGVEHIIITSFTLPGDIVMNGGLYSREERDKSFLTLNRTLAPIEHPHDGKGGFLSANDPVAIHNFHAGVYNDNAEIDEATDRIKIEKFINVAVALKSDLGKRVIDRVEEIENSDNPRPIHTSVGVYLSQEILDEPETNSEGQTYTWVGSDFHFDHDSILLDSVGAAQPHQGVGIGINSDNEKVDIETFVLNFDEDGGDDVKYKHASKDKKWIESRALAHWKKYNNCEQKPSEEFGKGFLFVDNSNTNSFDSYKLPFVDVVNGEPEINHNALKKAFVKVNRLKVTEKQKDGIQEKIFDLLKINKPQNKLTNEFLKLNEMSFGEIHRDIHNKLNPNDTWNFWIHELWDDRVVYTDGEEFFLQSYEITDGEITLIGGASLVEVEVTYKPIKNANNSEGEIMFREVIIKQLASKGIEVNSDITDEALKAKYDEMVANAKEKPTPKGEPTPNGDVTLEAIANTLAKVSTRLDTLDVKINEGADNELNELVEVVTNSKKYSEFNADELKAMGLVKVKALAANCKGSIGLPIGGGAYAPNADDDDEWSKAEMPK